MSTPKPTPMLDVFARLCRGRVSSLRGVVAIATVTASCLGPWPGVLWRCWTQGRIYATHVAVSLLLTPVSFWALLLHGANCPVVLTTFDRDEPAWWQRKRAVSNL